MIENREDISGATRHELQEYLENRGFAVYEKEDVEELREAARLMEREVLLEEYKNGLHGLHRPTC